MTFLKPTVLLKPEDPAVFEYMLDMLISLSPAALAGCVFFGRRALFLLLLCIAVSAVTEFLCGRFLRLGGCVADLSAVTAGLIIGMTLSPATPFIAAAVICVAATAVSRLLSRKIPHVTLNPAAFGAALAAVFRIISKTEFFEPFSHTPTAETPLTAGSDAYMLKQLLFGAHGGGIGETGSLFLLAGVCYLFIRRLISPAVPLSVLFGAAATALVLKADIAVALLGGGLLLAAFFIAPQSAVSLQKTSGKICYGLFCGITTVLTERFVTPNGAAYFAVLAATLLCPLFGKIPEINRKPKKQPSLSDSDTEQEQDGDISEDINES